MSFIDLHIHTTASDGSFSPTQVVMEADRRGLSVIAITDHDTVDGVEEALNARDALYGLDNVDFGDEGEKLIVVPGVEISSSYEGREVHILGLFVDHKDEVLKRNLSTMKKERDDRNSRIIELFQKAGIPVTMDDLIKDQPDCVITRAHFARYLVEKGYVKSKDEAFKKYLGEGRPFYIPRSCVEADAAIEWIHNSGGMTFLAHPYLYGWKENKLRNMICSLKEMGLDGLEAYHSSTDMGRTNQLREYGKQMGLLICGGSDFHGSNMPYIHLGVGKGNLRITRFVYDKIINKQV